jgi:hypothetical protein
MFRLRIVMRALCRMMARRAPCPVVSDIIGRRTGQQVSGPWIEIPQRSSLLPH